MKNIRINTNFNKLNDAKKFMHSFRNQSSSLSIIDF
jgi:hypothetical protein